MTVTQGCMEHAQICLCENQLPKTVDLSEIQVMDPCHAFRLLAAVFALQTLII